MCTRPFGDSGEPDTDFALRWPSLVMDTDLMGSAITGAAGRRGSTGPGVASEC